MSVVNNANIISNDKIQIQLRLDWVALGGQIKIFVTAVVGLSVAFEHDLQHCQNFSLKIKGYSQ